MTRLLRGALALVPALLLVACSGAEDPQAADAPEPTTSTPTSPEATTTSPEAAPGSSGTPKPDPTTSATPEPEPEPVVPDILQFEATTVGGETFDGASVAGRPVVLWFWAPWCSVCRSQAPDVTALAEQYGDEIAFVGVGSLDSSTAIASFADEVAGPIHLSDPDGALYARFSISEQSSFVVLDAAGDEVLRTGYAADDELAGTVAELAG